MELHLKDFKEENDHISDGLQPLHDYIIPVVPSADLVAESESCDLSPKILNSLINKRKKSMMGHFFSQDGNPKLEYEKSLARN